MIIDYMEYLDQYTSQIPNLENALQVMRENPNLDVPRFDFEGGYIMIQHGMTRDLNDGFFEAHEKYIDVQIMLEGQEIIFWNRTENMEAVGDYNVEQDKLALTGSGAESKLTSGMFAIMFPSDAHAPCRHMAGDTPHSYKKCVFKLLVV